MALFSIGVNRELIVAAGEQNNLIASNRLALAAL